MSNGLILNASGFLRASRRTVRIAANVTRPWDRTRGERPPLIKYLDATAFAPKSMAAARQEKTPFVVMEKDILTPGSDGERMKSHRYWDNFGMIVEAHVRGNHNFGAIEAGLRTYGIRVRGQGSELERFSPQAP